MPRTESPINHSLVRRAHVLPHLACLMVVLTSNLALGHTLLLSQGEVVIDERAASIELEVSAEDFVHWYGIGPVAGGDFSVRSLRGAAERHALALHQIFTFRDAAGRRLSSEPFNDHLDWPSDGMITTEALRALRAKYTTRFSYPSTPRFLTFQILMDGTSPGVLWQTILSVHGSLQDRGRTLRLTSRGNAETIELRWNDGMPSVLATPAPESLACAGEGVAGLKEVCADIDVGMESVEVRISIPLVLLQTWLTLDGNDDELLDPDEQKSARNVIEPLLGQALIVESEGCNSPGQISDIAFLAIDGNRFNLLSERTSVSLITGRVTVRLHFETITTLQQAEFHWNLFNNAVLSAGSIIKTNGVTSRHEFSTYQPSYHWQRG